MTTTASDYDISLDQRQAEPEPQPQQPVESWEQLEQRNKKLISLMDNMIQSETDAMETFNRKATDLLNETTSNYIQQRNTQAMEIGEVLKKTNPYDANMLMRKYDVLMHCITTKPPRKVKKELTNYFYHNNS